jgi:hypothetical protein
MKLIDKATALGVFVRLLKEHVDRLEKKYVKLVKKEDSDAWDVRHLLDNMEYYENLIEKVHTWMYNTYEDHNKEHGE